MGAVIEAMRANVGNWWRQPPKRRQPRKRRTPKFHLRYSLFLVSLPYNHRRHRETVIEMDLEMNVYHVYTHSARVVYSTRDSSFSMFQGLRCSVTRSAFILASKTPAVAASALDRNFAVVALERDLGKRRRRTDRDRPQSCGAI